MALRTAHRRPHPDDARRPDPVGRVLGQVLGRLQPSLRRHPGEPVVGRRDLLLLGRLWHQISRQLLPGKPVEGHIVPERPQHIVAIGPRRKGVVPVKPSRVGIAHRVQPVHRLLLGVPWGGQQPVDQPGIGVRCRILDKGRNLSLGRGNPRQIQHHPPEQGPSVGLRRRTQARLGQPPLDEAVDRIVDPRPPRRNRWPGDGLVGPVPLIRGSLGNPALDQLLLLHSQRLVRLFRRHDLRRLRREDTPHHLALLRVPRHDRPHPRSRLAQRLFPHIQPHPGLAATLVRPVTAKTGVREDRSDVPIETDGRLTRHRHRIELPPHQAGNPEPCQQPQCDLPATSNSFHCTLA